MIIFSIDVADAMIVILLHSLPLFFVVPGENGRILGVVYLPMHPIYRTSKSIRALVADTGTKSCGIESLEVTVFIQK